MHTAVRYCRQFRPGGRANSTGFSFYAEAAAALIDAFRLNITAAIGEEFALSDVAKAHTELEAGRTTGSLLLIP